MGRGGWRGPGGGGWLAEVSRGGRGGRGGRWHAEVGRELSVAGGEVAEVGWDLPEPDVPWTLQPGT